MGCASSSPLINGGGPGGVVESAKEAATKTATDVLHAGETAIHDVGEHVKEAVHNVTHELENVLGGKKDTGKSDTINEDDQPTVNGHADEDGEHKDYQIIRLKGSKQNSVDETLENMKNDMMSKVQGTGQEADTDRMADDLMRETEEVMRDAETGIAQTRQQVADEMTTRITSSEDGTIEILNLEGNAPKSPNNSIDSLKTTSPEPEIERILAAAGDADDPASPKATLNTLTVPAGAPDEGMPMGVSDPPAASKPDVILVTDTNERVRLIRPQASSDSNSMTSDNESSCSEERFLREVQKATSTHTPGRTVQRSPTGNRPPPPSTAASSHVQRFIFKLNSIILSDIEERVDEDSSIIRQLERNPDRVVELLGKSSLDSLENAIERPELDVTGDGVQLSTSQTVTAARLRRQQSVMLEEPDELPEATTSSCDVDVENVSSNQTMATIQPWQDVPPAIRLRALKRFKSLDCFRPKRAPEADDTDKSLRSAYARWQPKSLDATDFDEAQEPDGDEQANNASYDAEEEERICGELLAQLRTLEEEDRAEKALDGGADGTIERVAGPFVSNQVDNGDRQDPAEFAAQDDHQTAWEKLQDYLQCAPKRSSSNYDLLYENEEDILKILFYREKTKLLFHYSDSSSSSTDTL